MRSKTIPFSNKGKIFILVLCSLLAVTCLMIHTAKADTGIVNTGVANVRSGPGTNNEIVGTVYKDTEVDILETSGSWYKIKLGNLNGWMSDTVLDIKISQNVIVTGEKVNLRSGPGTNYDILGQVVKGDKLGLISSEGDWFKIKTASGPLGYIAASLVQKEGTSAPEIPVKPPVVEQQTGKFIQVISGSINVRSGAGTAFPEIAKINDNNSYSAIGQEGDWVKISLPDGRTGYVAGWLVKEVTEGTSVPVAPTVPSVNTSAPPGTPVVYLNGQKLSFDVPPVIENDRTLVPLRAIFEAVGANVQWDQSTQTVKAARGQTTVILTIGSLKPTVNGQIWPLDVPAKIVKDRTLAPLRFVGEAFGGNVGWDAASYTVTIETKPDNAIATSITVSNGSVNLRSGPATSYDTLDILDVGEKLAIISERDGWYQVSRSGRSGWVAGWVVDVAWEENEPVEDDPVIEPEPKPEPEPEKPKKPGKDVVWLSSNTDENGLHIIMESGSELDSEVEKKYPGLIYTFKDKQIEGLYLLKKDFGNSYVRAEANNRGDDLEIEISLPAGIKYDTEVSKDGKKEIITISNYITSVERKTFGNTGERIIINTPLPVVYSSKLDDDIIEVTLENTLIGKADDSYRFSNSDLIKRITFEPDAKEKSTLVTIHTDNLGKHAFAESGENEAFTILLIEKSEMKPRKDNLVVLDPGHGGSDSGARGTELWEKDVNLDIALKVGNILTKNGVKVEYTRKTDITVGLEERAMLANDLNAGVFVSIHNNANLQTDKQGTETYFYAPLSTPELYMQRDERQLLAKNIQKQLVSKLRRIDRGVKESNFSVLRNTTMPSALAEVMFISCPDEQDLLKQDKYKTLAAEAIAQGILDYLKTK